MKKITLQSNEWYVGKTGILKKNLFVWDYNIYMERERRTSIMAKCENCRYAGRKNRKFGDAWTSSTCPKCGNQWFRWKI
jgi:ssDNA-binding Zn-finger/Zn-ribbon topoisomerase 1